MKRLITLLLLCICGTTFAVEQKPAVKTKIKYRKSRTINFEKHLIEGQNKKGEIDVITGNVNDRGDGLLRLKENFLDEIALEAGERVQ